MRPRATRHGFTLLEVMVAIAILSLSLTAIYSSQAGAIRMAARARHSGVAALLARCKMAELEEQVADEGFPALLDQGTDECCEEGEVEGYSCDWEIAPIVLPDTMFAPEEGDGTDGPMGGDPTAQKAPGAQEQGEGPLSALTNLASGGGDPSQLDPSSLLAGGGTEGIAAMAMGFVFPVLKPAFEAQIRRATVIVNWKEGDVPHEMDVTQYMVAGTPIQGVDPNDPNAAVPGAPGAGGTQPGGATTGGALGGTGNPTGNAPLLGRDVTP